MKQFGLIGHPLSHSFSQRYFTAKFERENIEGCEYLNFPISSIQALPQLLKEHPELVGLNVTIPYKEQVIPYLQGLEGAAKDIQAVNTLKITNEGLLGYNTDAYGFHMSIKPFLKSHHERALILGTGGASKAIAYVLKSIGIDVMYASRKPQAPNELGYDQLNVHAMNAFLLIVNCTPLGTYPAVEAAPLLPYEHLGNQHLLYDLVYNPEVTTFLKHGQNQGAATLNGYNMLKLQAEKAWEIWNR